MNSTLPHVVHVDPQKFEMQAVAPGCPIAKIEEDEIDAGDAVIVYRLVGAGDECANQAPGGLHADAHRLNLRLITQAGRVNNGANT